MNQSAKRIDAALPNALPQATGKGLSVSLWIVQVLLAALFLFSGLMKFIIPVEQMVKQGPLPGWFLHFIGVAELLGGIGLLLPALLRIRPMLTPLAACGLVPIMIGATVLSLPQGAFALFPCLIGVLAAFVAYGRWRFRPISPRH